MNKISKKRYFKKVDFKLLCKIDKIGENDGK